MKNIDGDLIAMADAGDFDVIIHGCNCYHTMGAGIAKQIAARWPAALLVDRETRWGDKAKLGTCSFALANTAINTRLHIINAYTQFGFGVHRGKAPVDYKAIARAMDCAASYCRSLPKNIKIGYPAIGCGLAGGSWEIVSKLIDTALQDFDHTFVRYVKKANDVDPRSILPVSSGQDNQAAQSVAV